MGTSGKPSASRVLLLLAVVVVAVGGVSLLVTGAGRTTPVNHAVLPVARTPEPLNCEPDQLALVGAVNECASIDAASRSCDITMVAIDNTFNLTSSVHHYELDIEVPQFAGPGDYALGQEALTVVFYGDDGAEWRSVTGTLTVVDDQGRSGTVDAILEPWVGNISVIPLSVSGPWACG